MSDKCKHGVRDTATNLPYCKRCDDEAKAHSLHRRVSRHRKFWMETPDGNDAHILGDPRMPAATKRALGEMIDAAVKAANAGKLEMPANDRTERRGPAALENQKHL